MLTVLFPLLVLGLIGLLVLFVVRQLLLQRRIAERQRGGGSTYRYEPGAMPASPAERVAGEIVPVASSPPRDNAPRPAADDERREGESRA